MSRDDWLYPRGRYAGNGTPEELVFNANLQEFAQRVGIITSLETGGKIPPEDAFNQIAALWEKLKCSKDGVIGAD